jgi:hypothetical protein
MVAEFMRVGMGQTGARATAQVQQDPFLIAVEGFAGSVVEDTLNHGGPGQAMGLVERIAYLNFPDLEGPPRLSMSLVDSTSLTELATYTMNLSAQGRCTVMTSWRTTCATRRTCRPRTRRPGTRSAQEEAAQKAAAAPPRHRRRRRAPPAPSPRPRRRPRSPPPETHARQQRPLRHYEQHMSLDDIEQAIDGARARFQAAGDEHARAAAADVAATVAAGKKPKATPPDELAGALHGVLTDLYALGRRTVDAELAAQGAHGPEQPVQVRTRGTAARSWLARRAAAAAREVMSAIIRAADRADMQGLDHAGMQHAAETAAGAALRAEAVCTPRQR